MEDSTSYNTVFIDTSLDTHLALIVSDADTVSDLEKKLMYEHPRCFPNFGKIKIHALKVKRKGYFYHLTDHMFVKSAFAGVKNSWFLSIDASSLINHDKSKLSSDPGSSNALICITNGPLADGVDLLPDGTSKKLSIIDDSELHQFERNHFLNQKVPVADHFSPDASIREVLKDLEMEVKHVSGDHCKNSSSDSSQKLDSGIHETCDLISKGKEMPGRLAKYKIDNSLNGISDLQCNVPLEEKIQSGAVSKKKSKTKRKFEALVDSCALKVNDGSVDASSKDILEQEITVPHIAGNACKEIRNDTGMGNNHIIDEPGKNLSADWAQTQVTGMRAESNDDRLKENVVDLQLNLSLGEASEAVTAAKKKRKIKGKSTDPLIEKEALICNFSKETSKPDNIILGNTMDDKQKTTTATYDSLSTRPPQDDNLICNNANSEKKKKKTKKKITSSSCNDVADIREERSKETLGMPRKDSGKESNEAINHVQSVQDAIRSEPCSNTLREIQSAAVREVGAVHEVLSHDMGTSEVNADKTGNERESSQNNDPKVLLPEKNKPSDRGETEMSMKEVVVSSKLLDGNGIVEPGKSTGRGKRPKKTKNTDGSMQATSGKENANSLVRGITLTEPHKAMDGGHSDKKTKKGKSVPSQTNVAEFETVNTLKLGGNLEAHEVHGNVEESVQPMQAGKTEEIPVNWDVKGRKKSRKKMSSSVENIPVVQLKEQNVGHSAPSIDKTKEADVSPKNKKKSNLVETGSENPINGSNLQSEKESESLQCQVGVDVESMSGRADETIKKIGDSISQGDGIKFSDYFLPRQQQHEVAGSVEAFDDKVIEVNRSERKMEAKKNSEKVDQNSVGTSPDLHDPLRSNDNHDSERESGVGNSNTTQGSLRKDKSDKLLPGSKKKSSKVSENKGETQRSVSRPDIVKASVTTTPARANFKEIDKASSALRSSSKLLSYKYKSQSNQRSITAKKASGENPENNIFNRGKSLLAISGSILKDDNGDSSEDDGFVDSDSSTRTPSDDSSSSDYSEVENNAGSPHGTKRKVDGGNFSALKNMTLDAVLKSSSRFKKAKITASQSQIEDSESQPVDFVPDSQANL